MIGAQSDEQIQRDIDEIVGGLEQPGETVPTTEVQITQPRDISSGFQLGGLVIYLMLAVLVVGLGWLIYQVIRNSRSTASSRKSRQGTGIRRKRKNAAVARSTVAEARDPMPAEQTRDPRIPLDVEEWLAKAAIAEVDGDYREAVRCRYRAVVSLLAHRSIVHENETTTAGEYVLSVNDARPTQTRNFATAAQIFETAWYSERPIDAQSAERMGELFDQLQVGTR